MKRKQSACITVMLVAALAIPVLVAAQTSPRYRLIDLGTFGGPASYFPNGLDGILNNHGVTVGWANTSVPDPFDPICITPNCFVAHAFQFQNGVLMDLGTLPAGASS